jgi:hypothetical protein
VGPDSLGVLGGPERSEKISKSAKKNIENFHAKYVWCPPPGIIYARVIINTEK